MAEEREGGLTTAGRYLDGKSVGKLWSIVGSRERERNEREKQQSARNVASVGGVRVVNRELWQLSGDPETLYLHFCTHVFALLGDRQ